MAVTISLAPTTDQMYKLENMWDVPIDFEMKGVFSYF
jgi:hypothetical protein